MTEGTSADFVVDSSIGIGRARLIVGGRTIHDGAFRFGSSHVTWPGQEARCFWHDPFESVHVFIPCDLLDAAVSDLGHDLRSGFTSAQLRDDPSLARMGMLWLDLQQEHSADLSGYSDWIGQAILRRVATTHCSGTSTYRSAVCALPSWRVQRVISMIDERLDARLTLADMASVARLSPMHFAAQFRRATGLSPHQFLIRRRVERAQDLLRTTKLSVAEIALATGFSSQTHFTTSFRNVTGSTPARWRKLAG